LTFTLSALVYPSLAADPTFRDWALGTTGFALGAFVVIWLNIRSGRGGGDSGGGDGFWGGDGGDGGNGGGDELSPGQAIMGDSAPGGWLVRTEPLGSVMRNDPSGLSLAFQPGWCSR
jgi:hypothetical protein